MPAALHGFDHSTNDDISALVAERSVKDSEVLLAILATFEFIENSILERAEALSAAKKIVLFCIIVEKVITTYTKHWICHNCPFELTIFS